MVIVVDGCLLLLFIVVDGRLSCYSWLLMVIVSTVIVVVVFACHCHYCCCSVSLFAAFVLVLVDVVVDAVVSVLFVLFLCR